MEASYGESGIELGAALREGGGVPILALLLNDSVPEIQQNALLIAANICSDSFDANSRTTKRALLECGGARALMTCVYADDPQTFALACGALQNLTHERGWAEQAMAILSQLEALLAHENMSVVRYASGALPTWPPTCRTTCTRSGARSRWCARASSSRRSSAPSSRRPGASSRGTRVPSPPRCARRGGCARGDG